MCCRDCSRFFLAAAPMRCVSNFLVACILMNRHPSKIKLSPLILVQYDVVTGAMHLNDPTGASGGCCSSHLSFRLLSL